MKRQNPLLLLIPLFLAPLFLTMVASLSAPTSAQGITDSERRLPPGSQHSGRWALAFENDILALGNRDKDYTYGLNLTYSGPGAASLPISPQPLQRQLDQWFMPTANHRALGNHSLEVGFYGFTPEDIEQTQPIADDRPYASLVYLQSTRETVNPLAGNGWTSSLSLGVLGLDIVGSGQNRVHQATSSRSAQGWANQISDGGELTAKYSLAYQQAWWRDNPGVEIKTTAQASVGYITEASLGLSWRAGRIGSNWWSFDPELANYGERSSPLDRGYPITEHYLWGGINLKARAYNVFLQGQFRHSDVSLQQHQLHHLLVEAWLGYTLALDNGYRFSYWLRGHSSEIRQGPGDRHLLWGGIVVAKTF